MSEETKIVGSPYQHKYKDKIYYGRPISKEMEAHFEQRLFMEVKEGARQMKDLLTPEEYKAHLLVINEEFVNHQYAYSSPKGMKAMLGIGMAVYLIAMIFDMPEAEAKLMMVDDQEEILPLLQLIIRESNKIDYEKNEKRVKARKEKEAAEEALKKGVLAPAGSSTSLPELTLQDLVTR